jgi:hypothetical protein
VESIQLDRVQSEFDEFGVVFIIVERGVVTGVIPVDESPLKRGMQDLAILSENSTVDGAGEFIFQRFIVIGPDGAVADDFDTVFVGDLHHFGGTHHIIVFHLEPEAFIVVGIKFIDPHGGGFGNGFFGMKSVIPVGEPFTIAQKGVKITVTALIKLFGFMAPEGPDERFHISFLVFF